MKSTCWNTRAMDSIIKSGQKDTEASLIGKMFINQPFAKSKAVINGETEQIGGWMSQLRFNISKNPSVTRCSIWCRLLNSP